MVIAGFYYVGLGQVGVGGLHTIDIFAATH